MPLDPKRVLITGGGSGIGRALAIEAARRGMVVAVCGRRQHALDETISLLGNRGHLALQADIINAHDRHRIVDRIEAEWGGLDVLVNNAGIIEAGPLRSLDDSTLARCFETNVIAPIALTRDLQPLLERAGSARVVNVGSVFGDIPYPMLAAYSASKFALRGFSIALRREWKVRGIGVTYVAPRATRTAALAPVERVVSRMRTDTPERVAVQIWDGVGRGTPSVYAPGPERLFVFLQRIFPSVIDRALSSRAPMSRSA
jgi:NAD(P)-dependent dehydrogenase (short-subunit alcohol dehydrogenase family)